MQNVSFNTPRSHVTSEAKYCFEVFLLHLSIFMLHKHLFHDISQGNIVLFTTSV